jgi:hypothetical protein
VPPILRACGCLHETRASKSCITSSGLPLGASKPGPRKYHASSYDSRQASRVQAWCASMLRVTFRTLTHNYPRGILRD